jgi:hypothetical protein
MSDLLDDQHARAILDLLTADEGLVSFDGRVLDGTEPPYVNTYIAIKRPAGLAGVANALDGLSSTCVVEASCHCVGATAAAARAVAMRVRAALLDQRPTITGRAVGLIRQVENIAPVRDETTGRLVMDALCIYSLTTAPG